MADVKLENLTKTYGDKIVLNQINLDINDGEFMVLVGPSGCGKSTALRLISGLDEMTSGNIHIDGKVVNHLAPKHRSIAMVFQDYALYPHLNVYDNMNFGLKLRKVPKAESEKRIKKASDMLGLNDLMERRPKELSGGQRQRVAIGRAVVRNPKAFLFDEPLSNLDAKLREGMRIQIAELHQKMRTTVIYVTHDQVEAMTLADRIAVMHEGVIQQIGTPLDVYHKPANRFVASFIGSPSMNFLKGKLILEGDTYYFAMNGLRFEIPPDRMDYAGARDGMEITLGVRPHRVQMADQATTHRVSVPIPAKVELLEQMGSGVNMIVSTSGGRLVVRCPADTEVQKNANIEIVIRIGRVHVFGETGRTLRPRYKG
jgi:multiple sugar transport system ATP-binding protein